MSEPKNVAANVENEATQTTDETTAATAGSAKAAPSSSPSSRKGSGAKELPAFKWKIIGESGSVILTLFKSIEREEAETQLDRLSREGYYQDLRIVDIDHPIKQSASAKIGAFRTMESKPKPSRRGDDRRRSTSGSTREKKSGKPAQQVKRATPKKPTGTTGAATVKTRKKKAPAAKSPKRRAKKK